MAGKPNVKYRLTLKLTLVSLRRYGWWR